MANDKIYCSKCGAENEVGSGFCKKCGADLHAASAEKPSNWWYLLPILFGILGGIIGYIVIKVKDEKMAKNILYVGLGTFVLGIIFIAAVPSPPPTPEAPVPTPISTPPEMAPESPEVPSVLATTDVGKSFEIGKPGYRYELTLESVDIVALNVSTKETYNYTVNGFPLTIPESVGIQGKKLYVTIRTKGIDYMATGFSPASEILYRDEFGNKIERTTYSATVETEDGFVHYTGVIPVEEGKTYRALLEYGYNDHWKEGTLIFKNKNIPRLRVL